MLHHGPFHPGVGAFGGPGDFFWPFLIARLVFFTLLFVIPWIIGLTYVRRDANQRGQPGSRPALQRMAPSPDRRTRPRLRRVSPGKPEQVRE